MDRLKMQKLSTSDEVATSHNVERFKYIPIRLSQQEREILTVLEAALEVSEYTDNVDVVYSHLRQSRLNRIISSLGEMLSISAGLMVAANVTKGEHLLKDKSLNENIPFFRDMFEVGRRYKIMNPTKMRDTYGKLMWILMDSEADAVKRELGINLIKELQTVYTFLRDRGGLDLLAAPTLDAATATLDNARSREELSANAREKAQAVEEVCVCPFHLNHTPPYFTLSFLFSCF